MSFLVTSITGIVKPRHLHLNQSITTRSVVCLLFPHSLETRLRFVGSLAPGLLTHRTLCSSGYKSPRKLRLHRRLIMSKRPASSSSTSSSKDDSTVKGGKAKTPPVKPYPSSSVILLSPTNEVLLLHRVQASSSFPSAHVFPGGHISSFHEPEFPPATTLTADDPEYHVDSLAYRQAAIRETFEESGILLAQSMEENQKLLALSPDVLAPFRTAVHGETVKFTDFLAKQGARPCTDGLVPFTRWITPAWNRGRRFTTQMYLFFMPLASSSSSSSSSTGGATLPTQDEQILVTPTSDGGIEHTAASFATPAEWLAQQAEGRIILFPPQCFLLTLVARVFDGVAKSSATKGPLSKEKVLAEQRKALLEFVNTPTATLSGTGGIGEERKDATTDKTHPTAMLPWTEKVISPEPLFTRAGDGRLVLAVDKPGFELKGSGRGGDFERVVLVHFRKEGPRNVEVRQRADVLREEKQLDKRPKTEPSRL